MANGHTYNTAYQKEHEYLPIPFHAHAQETFYPQNTLITSTYIFSVPEITFPFLLKTTLCAKVFLTQYP